MVVDNIPPAGALRVQLPHMDTKFIVSYWNSIKTSGDAKLMAITSHVLGVVSRMSSSFSVEEQAKLVRDLKHKVLRFDVEPNVAGSLVSALTELTIKKNTGALSDFTPEVRICIVQLENGTSHSSTSQKSDKWVSVLLESCEKILEEYVKGGNGGTGATNHVEKALFLVGEAVLVGFSPDGTVSTERSLLSCPASSSLIKLVQILLPPQLPLKGDAARQQPVPIPGKIRALAFVTLGKLCLRDQALAKQSINILLREVRIVRLGLNACLVNPLSQLLT